MRKEIWKGLYASTLEGQISWTQTGQPGVYVAEVKSSTLTLKRLWCESFYITLSIQEEDGTVTEFHSGLGTFFSASTAERLCQHVAELFKTQTRQKRCSLTTKILTLLRGFGFDRA